MSWGIRKTVLMLSLLPATVIALALTIFFTLAGINKLERAIELQGNSMAGRLATASEYNLMSGNTSDLAALLRATVREKDVSALVVTDASFQVMASVGGVEIPRLIEIARTIASGKSVKLADFVVFTAPVLLGTADSVDPFDIENARRLKNNSAEPLGHVVVALSLKQTNVHTHTLIVSGLTILIAGLLITVLATMWLSKRVTGPIMRLSSAVSAATRGDLNARVPADSYGELLFLEKGFNEMADAIQSAQQDLESRIAAATQQFLEQKESAELANLAKSRFLAAASHDLRQPLHAIGLFVGALSHKIRFPEVRSLVDKIEESVTTLESLLNALLDISRLDAAVVTPQFATFPIEVVLRQIGNEFTPIAASKNLRFKVRASHAIVSCDPMLLKRIVGNLVANAMRYTEKGGVFVGCRKRGDTLRLEVWDTGPGIPAEHREHIFEEFYQVDNARRDRNKGLGLGLAIVDRMARLLGIQVGFTTQPGRGSRFYIELPLVSELPQPVYLSDPEPEAQVGGMHIVVVDDERAVLEGMAALLHGMGSHVITAESLEEAVHRLRESACQPDLILSDYRLGTTQTGIDVILALRKEFGASIPAILISGDTSLETLHNAEVNNLEILHKPVNTAKLNQVLAKLTAHRTLPPHPQA